MDELSSRGSFVLGITSGKGGVGKTCIALNLAIQLARYDTKVLLIDGDLGLANLSILLEVNPENTLEDVIEGRCEIFEAMVGGPEGVIVVPSASGTGDRHIISLKKQEGFKRELAKIGSGFDLVLIDTGTGIYSNVTGLLHSVDEILVITTPEPTAIADAYALIKLLTNIEGSPNRVSNGRFSLLINMVESPQQAQDLKAKFDQMAERFLRIKVRDRGHVLTDRRVVESILRQVPFVVGFPECKASKCVADLARRIIHREGRNGH